MTQFERPLGPLPVGANEKDPAQLAQMEAEIGHTRDAISGDLRALGERLSPEHLKEDAREVMTDAKNAARETIREAKDAATATFREVKDSAMDTVSAKVDQFKGNVRNAEREALSFMRVNALPLALIGIGTAWFMSNRRKKAASWDERYASRPGYGRYPSDYGPRRVETERASRTSTHERDLAHRAKDQAKSWAENAEHQVSDVAGQVKGFAEREVEHVRGLARDAGHKLSDVAGNARDLAGRELEHVRDFSRRSTESYPLAVGAAALATGLCVGLLIPETRKESELFGAERDRLLGEAKGAARDWKDMVKDTARDVKVTLSDSPA